MPFIVVHDANPLMGNTQRDLLIRIAQTGLVQAKWTDRILDEAIGAIGKSRPDIPPEKLTRLRQLMIWAVPDGLISGHEPLIEVDDVLTQLERSGLVRSAATLRRGWT